MRKWTMILLLLLLLMLPTAAEENTYFEENLEQSGANALFDALSPETQELYRTIGVYDLSDLQEVDLEEVTSHTAELLTAGLKKPLASAAVLLAAIVLCAYLSGMRETVTEEGLGTVYGTVGVLTVSATVLLPFIACVRAVQKALSGAAVFMGSFSPVYIAVLAANGQLRAAASYQTVLLLFSQLMTWLTGSVLLPVLLAAVAMGTVSAVSDTGNLRKPGEMLLKAVTWTLGLAAGAFTTLLSVNSMLGAASDTLGNKMIKLSLSSFVPVVGGAVSEAFLTVKSCVSLVKTTVGAFGMLTVLLLLLPAMIECLCWLAGLWVCGMAAEAFSQTTLAALIKTLHTVVKTMIAAMATAALFMIVATALVTMAGGGGT